MGQHDLSYRLFFTHRRMAQDLLQKIVDEPWVEHLDFESGERASTSFISDEHDNRESDIIWKFRRNDGTQPDHVYIHLEFQSRPDPSMPVRVTAYRGLFYAAGLRDLAPESHPPTLRPQTRGRIRHALSGGARNHVG